MAHVSVGPFGKKHNQTETDWRSLWMWVRLDQEVQLFHTIYSFPASELDKSSNLASKSI